MHYSEATKTREGWARSLLDEFKSNVEMLKSAVRDQQGAAAPTHGSPQHGKHTHARRVCVCFPLSELARDRGLISVPQCPLGTMSMGR